MSFQLNDAPVAVAILYVCLSLLKQFSMILQYGSRKVWTRNTEQITFSFGFVPDWFTILHLRLIEIEHTNCCARDSYEKASLSHTVNTRTDHFTYLFIYVLF